VGTTTSETAGRGQGDPLVAAVEELTAEARVLRAEVRSLRWRNRVFVLLMLVIVAVGGGVMWDARHEIAQSNARWCPVARAIAERPGDPPPAGDAEQRARAQAVRDFFTDMARDVC
jgi:hypothetical protein